MGSASAQRLRCPCCEAETRRVGDALCRSCWRAVPADDRAAHREVWRAYQAHRATYAELATSVRRVARAAKIVLYLFGEAETDD